MRSLVLDLIHAWRRLWRQPVFSATATLMLGAGIGAATLVFTLVHTALLRDLPFRDPDALVWMYNARTERDRAPMSVLDLEDYQRDATTIAGLAVFTNWTTNITGSGDPERLEGVRVSGPFFDLLGAGALVGRPLAPSDEDTEARVAVLTHGLWQRRFGGEPSVVGQPLVLNGASYTVVGVMPRGFVFPFRDAEIAVPISLRTDPRRADRGANFLRVVARLAPGVTVAAADRELDRIARRLQQEYPNEDSRKVGVSLYPLHAEIVRDYRQQLWLLFAAVTVLIAVGCGNLANLMLVQGVRRQAELALQMSLGASRARLLRQLSFESIVIAVVAGVIGVGLAAAGLSLWRVAGPVNFPRLSEATLSWPVAAFAAALAVVIAVICGVAPARSLVRHVSGSLANLGRTVTSDRGHRARRRFFVALQIAGAVVMVAVMSLVARAFSRLERVDPGFTPDNVLSLQLSLPPQSYANRDRITVFFERVRERLESIPGVTRAGAVSLMPLTGLLSTMDVEFHDRPAPAPDQIPQGHFRIASAGYFSAARIPILEGREFVDGDRSDTRPVAIVSRTFAKRHWPGVSAVGKSLRIAQGQAPPWLEIVGVVSDVKQFGLDGEPTPDLYLPLHQMPASQVQFVVARMYWMVGTAGAPGRFARPVRDAVKAIDPEVAASSLRPLTQVVDSSLGATRVNLRLLEIFGVVALVLSAIGVYAVAAFSVGVRVKELAIRSALGANRRDLRNLVLRDELRPALVGLVVGLVAALVLATRLRGLLFETDPFDASVYVATSVLVLLASVIATFSPVRRATRSNPTDALRT